jgi:orotidine-5'-phosphate decarboxylase
VNPYLGGDAVAPFIEREDRGVFIVCRSSNPGARDLQDLPVTRKGASQPLYEVVAELAKSWNSRGNVGLVVGATYPEEMRRLRRLCPEMPLLVPGVGPQEGALEQAVQAGLDAQGSGIIVNASRSVLYASQGGDFAEAARQEAQALREAIEELRQAALTESRR